MYRITGDKELQDAAWRMFRSIEKMTLTRYGHAAISDVRNPQSSQLDYMESFWLAETLKYFYLIFSEPDVVNLDEYVLYVSPISQPDNHPMTGCLGSSNQSTNDNHIGTPRHTHSDVQLLEHDTEPFRLHFLFH